MNATGVVRAALAGTGIEVVGSCPVADYDAAAPAAFRASVVMARASRRAWSSRAARGRTCGGRSSTARSASRASGTIRTPTTRSSRSCSRAPTTPSPAPASPSAASTPPSTPPSASTSSPWPASPAWAHPGPSVCTSTTPTDRGGRSAARGSSTSRSRRRSRIARRASVAPPRASAGGRNAGGITSATAEVRSRCVVGQAYRYDEDQIGYHYDREKTKARLRGRPPPDLPPMPGGGDRADPGSAPPPPPPRTRGEAGRGATAPRTAPAAPWAAGTGSDRLLGRLARREPQPRRRLLEEGLDGLGVDALALAADGEAGVVHLAPARVLDAADDAVGAQGQRGAHALLEDLLHGARKAQQHHARRASRPRRPPRAGPRPCPRR